MAEEIDGQDRPRATSAGRALAFVRRTDEGADLVRRGAQLLVKVGAAASNGRLTVIETRDPLAYQARRHVHRTSAEAFYVLSGGYTFAFDEREERCGPGDFVFVPSGVAHGYTCELEGSRMLVLYAPGGLEALFEAQGPDAGASLTDVERAVLAEMYQTDWLE